MKKLLFKLKSFVIFTALCFSQAVSLADDNTATHAVPPSGASIIAEDKNDPDDVFSVAETMPSFMGGDLRVFRNWVMTKIEYPEADVVSGIEGRVVVGFIVERDGTVSNVEILSSPSESMSAEVMRVIKSSPLWTPGEADGDKIRIQYCLPVNFRLTR